MASGAGGPVADGPGRDGDELVWYAAYGSNLSRERFDLYRLGGTHPGGGRVYPGFRDDRPPVRVEPLTLDGLLYFATRSPVWGGGRAFFDPDAAGRTAARGYLLRRTQFADLVAQEMYREPGAEPPEALAAAVAARRTRLGPGRYETLVRAGELDGRPVLTFTAPWGHLEVDWLAPSAGYLRSLGTGLRDAHGWDAARTAGYLCDAPGVAEAWMADGIAALLSDGPPDDEPAASA